MDIWLDGLNVSLRILACSGLVLAIVRSLQLTMVPEASRGWRRGWIALAGVAVILAFRCGFILGDIMLPGWPAQVLLRHPIALALTSLAIAIGLNICIAEMRAIFLRRVQAVGESQPVAVVVMDWRGFILSANPTTTDLLGWTETELIGKELAAVLIPESLEVDFHGSPLPAREAHRAGLQHFHETGEAVVIDTRFMTKAAHRDGHTVPVEIRVSTHMTPRGKTFVGQITLAPNQIV